MRHFDKAAFAAAALTLPAAGAASDTISYTYDALGRLVAVSTDGGRNDGVAVSTGYDPAGNRSNYVLTGAGAAGLSSTSSSASSGGETTGLDEISVEEEAEEEVPAATVEAPPPGGIPDESEPVVEIAPPEDGGAAGASGADR
jgi:YD repeat-containing protein